MSTITPAPDQSAKAEEAITDALYGAQEPISHATARLIAAAIQPSRSGPLAELAATGGFDPPALKREVLSIRLPSSQEPWRLALLDYVESIESRSHPWARRATRPLSHRERPGGLPRP